MFARILGELEDQRRVSEERHGENKETLEEIKAQTTLTNGRVTKLETKMQGRWKYLMGGGAGVSLTAIVLWELFKFFFGK